jgi:hypothetical protein
MKTLFKKFLRSEKMLSEFEHNFKTHGFRDQTLDEFLSSVDPDSYITSAFQWSKTSRNEDNHEDGQRFWNELVSKWYNYWATPTKKTSDRQKIKDAITRYFAALNVGDIFYGSILAEYALDRAKCKNKYKATVIQYMNQMKRKGLLNYECISREQSKYKKL